MGKRPLRQLNNPLTRNQPRKGKPLLLYLGFSLLAILGLNAYVILRVVRAQRANNDAQGSNSLPQQPQKSWVEARDLVKASKSKSSEIQTPAQEDSGTDATILFLYNTPNCQGNPIQKSTARSITPVNVEPSEFPLSLKVRGTGMADTYIGSPPVYKGSTMEMEGCVEIFELLYEHAKKRAKFVVYSAANQKKVVTTKRQIPPELQKKFATTSDLSKPHTRFVFSTTSSKYFGYQLYANALGFLGSHQTNASWMRLMSSGKLDDLSEHFPTFTAPKSLYQIFYQPINKPDVIDKWFHSLDAPHPDDTIAVIDPDNWLINDLDKWVQRVQPKNALAQAAYYKGNNMLQDLWQDICKKNCHVPTDPGAVPYLLKASDLKEVAPLWREYSIIIKERFKTNATFKEKYGPGLGVRWASEMFGYNGACTHLGIKTTIVSDMQLRDVDGGKRQWDRLRHSMPMIHMGRAWFPKEKPELAAPWRHSSSNEPNSVRASGIQVWCKCNGTAPFVQPWPLPDNLDFVSYHTLRLLHDSVEKFGPVPVNETFRKENLVHYAWSVP